MRSSRNFQKKNWKKSPDQNSKSKFSESNSTSYSDSNKLVDHLETKWNKSQVGQNQGNNNNERISPKYSSTTFWFIENHKWVES